MSGDWQERAEAGSLLPARKRTDGVPPVMAALGEGLLEVGLTPDLDPDALERGFGGDAANVAVMAARLGIRTSLITHVGEDAVGRLLLEFWAGAGVDVSRVSVDPEAPTGLYVNERRGSGAHTFRYYRSGSAASSLGPADLDDEFLGRLDLLHVTGITLSISSSSAAAAHAAADAARAAGAMVAFDVNYRSQLEADAAEILAFARGADIVFMADDDAEAVIGTSTAGGVREALGPKPREILITHGASPAILLTPGASYSLRPPPIEVVNAAGAGDALAGVYLGSRLAAIDPRQALARAVGAASASCRRSGCARGYPFADEVESRARGLAATVDHIEGSSAPASQGG